MVEYRCWGYSYLDRSRLSLDVTPRPFGCPGSSASNESVRSLR